jgi:hypothetical protein
MPVTQEQINRINELAHLSKERELTAEEKAEQAQLRQAYVAAVRASLRDSWTTPMWWTPRRGRRCLSGRPMPPPAAGGKLA